MTVIPRKGTMVVSIGHSTVQRQAVYAVGVISASHVSHV